MLSNPEMRSAEWWLHRLYAKIVARQPELERYDSYYKGDHQLPFVPRELKDEVKRFLELSGSNFCGLVVDSVEERMNVSGFRTSAENDQLADTDSWRIWQENKLDSLSQIAFTESLVKGISYISVWGDQISIEDPLQVYVEYEPGTLKRAAALKLWVDDIEGMERANVYLPDGIYKFARPDGHYGQVGWEEFDFLPNPHNVVPIVPLINRPNIHGDGRSEIDDIIITQDRINKTLFDRLMASEFSSFRQRWATGIDIPVDEATGEPIQPFRAAVDRVWLSEDPNARFGEFGATDLKPYIEAIEQDVLHIAVTSRTPRHYLIQQGQSPSGDAMKSAETGLVSKVKRKQKVLGEAIEEVMRLARLFAGFGETPADAEVVWADPEYRSEGELVDALLKMGALGVPREVLWERWGATPQEIARWKAMQTSEELLRGLLQEDDDEEVA